MIDTKELLDAVDVDTLLGELKLDYAKNETTAILRCPLGTHADESPSFLVYYDSKMFECKSCSEHGDAIKLTARITQTERHAAALWLARRFRVRTRAVINPIDVENWCTNLKNNAQYRQILYRKGLTDATLTTYKIGFNGERVTIPITDREGAYVNIRGYNPFAAKSNDKYTNAKDAAETDTLYPFDNLKHDRVFVPEGELKALCLTQNGFPAAAPTGGASRWRKDWNVLFKDKIVYFVYDVDVVGKRNAASHAKEIYQYAKCVYLIELPINRVEMPHGDVCDYFGVLKHTAADFQKLVDEAAPWQPQQIREPDRDQEVYPAPLYAATQAKFYSKRVECEAVVSAKDTAPYLVPSKIQVSCDRDQTVCASCPIFAATPNGPKGTVEVELDAESPKILQLLDVPTAKLQATLRMACGIPERCPACTCRAAATCNVEEVRLVPQTNIGDSDSQAVVTTVFYVGHGIETNASYKIRMRVYPSPKTQHAVGLCYEAEPNADNLSTFEVTDGIRDQLRVFQPSAWTVEAIESKLAEIYADLAANVTRIYQRSEVHLFVDLIYHSVLRFSFDGVPLKGWTEGLVIGDSGQGKSEASSRLRAHYGLGEKLGDKSATVAGLIGGLQETGKRWMLTWGAIPMNDRRLVIIEEAKGIPVETLQKLTDMRSSGVAEIVKIEKRKTNARCRLLWLSNPRSQRKMDTYNYGVEAVKELFGTLEDVRRLDMAMVVASGQVPMSVVNQAAADRPIVEHKHTEVACQNAVLFAWSRKPEDVHFEPEAIRAVLTHAEKLGMDYSSGIPLVEPADQRLKLARLAVALACRTFSVDRVDSRDRVVVREAHVEAVVRFLRRIYDDPHMGYKAFSAKHRAEDVIVNPDEIRDAIFKSQCPRDLVRSLLHANVFDSDSLANFGNFAHVETQAFTSLLVRKNCVLAVRRSYVKTPAFTSFLRKLDNSEELEKQEKALAMFKSSGGKGPDPVKREF